MGVASMKSGGAPLLETTRGMAWKWILEKVVHCPDFGTIFLKGEIPVKPQSFSAILLVEWVEVSI